MVPTTRPALARLYEVDETVWLDQTADLVRRGRFDQIDAASLAEYLTDMAIRDRREVYSRLVVLLAHVLKWDYQPKRRTVSWELTILEQRCELRMILESGSLRNHAVDVFAAVYLDAREQAAVETELARSTFPEDCPWDMSGALADRGGDA